jgi:hypothetical protein
MVLKLLIAALVVLFAGALPVWPYSRRWGYLGAGGIGVILVLVLLLHRQNVI